MNDPIQQLDEFVEAYEAARESGADLDLADFVPPVDHPQRSETIVELVRVDLEYGWTGGHGRRVEQYQGMFPQVLCRGEELEKVAYEEYRLRRLAGENVARADYSQRFAIDTQDWPELPLGEAPSQAPTLSCQDAGLRELSQLAPQWAQRMAAAAREMPQVGERFEGFDLVGELGRGAFGCVFLARQDDLARRFVALKITPQFSEEPQRLAQLQHTNVVPIYSVHRTDRLQAICMPFLGPNTLGDLLKTFELSRSLPLSGRAIVSTIAVRSALTVIGDTVASGTTAQGRASSESVAVAGGSDLIQRLGNMSYLNAAVWIMSRVADGLASSHEHGIVHRDLKPANILLTDDGEPLILDFNLATDRSAIDATAALIGGTLPYIGPEHMRALRDGGDVGPESDIYSVGVILFQMLTGRLPYPLRQGSFGEIVGQMLEDRREPLPSVRTLNPAVTPGLEAIVRRCLATQPSQRYPTARSLQEDLQRHLDHQPLRYVANRSIVERCQKWARRHPRLASGSSVALLSAVIILALAAAVWTRGNRLESARAQETLRQFESELDTARTVLNSPFVDDRELDAAVHSATAALDRVGVTVPPEMDSAPIYERLGEAGEHRLRNDAAELLYLLASGKAQQAVRDRATSEHRLRLDEALQLNSLINTVRGDRGDSPAIALQRARLLAAAGRQVESERVTEQLNSVPDMNRDLRTLAVERAAQHQYEEAAKILEQLIQDLPPDHTLWFCLGNCYLSARQYARAEECYTAALSLRPDFALGFEHRGIARLLARNCSGALRDFNTTLHLKPLSQSALVNRALARQGLAETPRLDQRKAADRSTAGEESPAPPDRDLSLHQAGIQQAIDDLTRALELGCTQTRIYFIRSQLRAQLGDAVGAEADLREGMSCQPGDELSWIARGIARLDEDPRAALADFRQALNWNARSIPALQNIAHVLAERMGDLPAAVDTLDQLIAIDPTNAAALAGRGVLLARLGHRDASHRDARAALGASSETLLRYQVACIYALTSTTQPEDKERAIRLLASALQADAALVEIASQDRDLLSLRDDPAVRRVLSAADTVHKAASE